MRLWKAAKHDTSSITHMVMMHAGSWVKASVVGVSIGRRLILGRGDRGVLRIKDVGLVDSARRDNRLSLRRPRRGILDAYCEGS